MPPARRKGYTYTEQPGGDHASTTWAVTRDRDGVGLGAFLTNPELYAAIDADRDVDPDRAAVEQEFGRTHLDTHGPDLRQAIPEPAVDGTRQAKP